MINFRVLKCLSHGRQIGSLRSATTVKFGSQHIFVSTNPNVQLGRDSGKALNEWPPLKPERSFQCEFSKKQIGGENAIALWSCVGFRGLHVLLQVGEEVLSE